MMNLILLGLIVVVSLVLGFFAFWKFWFLRDPERAVPEGDFIVAPADGKVLKIVDLDNVDEVKIKKGHIGKIKTLCSDVGKSCYLVSIFMNPLSVHIQRAAHSGKVLSVKHKNGTLGVTMSFKNGLSNEKTETLIENKDLGRFKIIQIAGFIVKRIENWLEIGQDIVKGQRMGLINFGSQVSLIVPKAKVRLLVKEGDKVRAGSTKVAEVK